MEYIISEQQSDRLSQRIIKFFDDNLTPYIGWVSPDDYKTELEWEGPELFFFLEDSDGDGEEDEHMYYSLCDNPESGPYAPADCPFIYLPYNIYDKLNGFFGDIWKPIFIAWFANHTGLEVKYVGGDFGMAI